MRTGTWKKALALAAASACCLAAAGSVYAAGEDTILLQMEEANQADKLMEGKENISLTETYCMEDDTQISAYCYRDGDRRVMEQEEYVLIDEDGDVYGFDDESRNMFRYLFVGDSYQEVADDTDSFSITFDDTEEVESVQEDEDGIHVQTAMAEADAADWLDSMGYVPGDGQIKWEYLVEPETYVILTTKASITTEDGQEKLIYENRFAADTETYEPAADITESVFSEDKRTVTLIADAGTPEEETFTQEVGKGCAVLTILSEEYEQEFYTDEEYTQIYEEGGDYETDQVLYIRHAQAEDAA